MIDASKITRFANQYAKTRDPDDFDDLFRLMYPVICYDARKHAIRTNKYGVVYEDLVSIFSEVVYEEALEYKAGRINFLQAYRRRAGQRLIDFIRYKKGLCRFEARYDELDADPIKAKSKIETHDEDGAFMGWAERVEDSYNMEEFVVDALDTEKMLTDFVQKAHEQYGKIIRLLTDGYTNQEIAREFGANEYTPKIRKTVQRARENFQKYVDALKQAC